MRFAYGSARDWAADHSAAMEVRFGRLETIAFQRHPDIYRHFGTDGALYASAKRPQRSAISRAGSALLVTLAVVGVVAPAAAVSVLGADRFEFFRMEASRSVPIAGALFVLAAITQIVLLVRWVRTGARYDGFTTGIVTVATVFSLFGLMSFPNIAAYPGSEGWEAWYPAVVVTFGVSLLSLFAMLARRGARPAEAVAEHPATAPGDDPGDVTALIAALPAAERADIERDRNDALRTLHARDLIDDAAFDRARATPLGRLHTLDEEHTP